MISQWPCSCRSQVQISFISCLPQDIAFASRARDETHTVDTQTVPPLKVSKPSTATQPHSHSQPNSAKLPSSPCYDCLATCATSCKSWPKGKAFSADFVGALEIVSKEYLIKPWIWICPDFQKTLDSDNSFFACRVDRSKKTEKLIGWTSSKTDIVRTSLDATLATLDLETGRKDKHNINIINVKNSHSFF